MLAGLWHYVGIHIYNRFKKEEKVKRISSSKLMSSLNIRSYRKLQMLNWLADKVTNDIELSAKDISDKLQESGYTASLTDYVYAYQAMRILKLNMDFKEFGGDSAEHLEILPNG